MRVVSGVEGGASRLSILQCVTLGYENVVTSEIASNFEL